MEARIVVRNRLFPLKGNLPAASVNCGVAISKSSGLEDGFVKTRFADNEDDYAYYFDCRVEPHGYYLIKNYLKSSLIDNTNENRMAATVALRNGLLPQGIEIERMILDPFLKTDILTVVHTTIRQHQLCAVNQQANQIYLYTVDVISKSIQNLFSRKKLVPELRVLPAKNTGNTVGTCVFESLDRKIVGIAGSPALNSHILTIAFDDGEIIVGKIKHQQFQQIKQLKKPTAVRDEVTLLASEDGCVVVHSSATHNLYIWFLHQEDNPEFYLRKYENAMMPTYTTYDKVYLDNINISPDGDYVYGLEVQPDGKYHAVQCFSLRELRPAQRIKFTDAIADFAIGEKGQPAVIPEDVACKGTRGLPTMIALLNIKHLLQNNVDAIDLTQLHLSDARSQRK